MNSVDSGSVFLFSMAMIAVGSVVLGLYVWALYRIGYWLGGKLNRIRNTWAGVSVLAVAWFPFSLFFALIPVHPFLRFAFVISGYLLHAQPSCIGFWAHREVHRHFSSLRFSKNVDDWLGEWECEPVGEKTEGPDDIT